MRKKNETRRRRSAEPEPSPVEDAMEALLERHPRLRPAHEAVQSEHETGDYAGKALIAFRQRFGV